MTETVEFRDGTKITVSEATWMISMKLQNLQEQAGKEPLTDPNEEIFHTLVYPKLASCSTGDVPDYATAKDWPSSELDKWYFAVRRVNPDWFAPDIAEAGTEAESAEKNLNEKKQLIESTPG